MRCAAALLLALAACVACAPPDDGRAPPDDAAGVVRLVTWNVHDLFDANDRREAPGAEDTVPSPQEVERKLARVAAVLRRIDADVAVLQEVENAPLLDRLAASLGGSFHAFLREGRDPRGIDVGVLSRVPFRAGPSHLDDRAADGSWLWARDVLELELEGPRLAVLGAHLVSRREPAQEPRRIAQARRLRELADALRRAPGAPSVVVLGDLNDLPESATLHALLGAGSLLDLGAALPAGDAWTWSAGRSRERIDYALLAGEGVRATRVRVEGGSDVAEASDHRPVVVDLWAGAAVRERTPQ